MRHINIQLFISSKIRSVSKDKPVNFVKYDKTICLRLKIKTKLVLCHILPRPTKFGALGSTVNLSSQIVLVVNYVYFN